MIKRLLVSLAVLASITVLPFSVLASPALGEKPEAITLTWSDNPKTTQTISWRTDSSVNASFVQYRPASNQGSAFGRKDAVMEVFKPSAGDNAPDYHFFTVTLSGLKPGTQYVYSVAADQMVSENKTFTTEGENVESFKFLVFGDSQSGNFLSLNYEPWRETIHHASQRNPDAKFLVTMGDLVEVGQSYNHWSHWFQADQDVISTLPIMPVQGNHETYSSTGLPSDPKPVYYIRQFRLFQNGPEGLKTQVYSYDYGLAHFVVLDSQQDEEGKRYGDILKKQSAWLDQDLAATHQPWKIALFHKPPYHNKMGRPNEAVKAAFCPVFDRYHVDLVLNGHEHVVARTHPMKNGQAQSSPREGTVYYITGRSGAKFYNDSTPESWDDFFYNPSDQPCYETVQIEKDRLTITAWKTDGTLIDDYSIHK